MHKASYSNSLFAKKYQLENNLRPFNRAEVQTLPKDRYGLYALWLARRNGKCP